MKFQRLTIDGAYLIDPEPFEDFRGRFTRIFCGREGEALGLNVSIAQCSISYNKKNATLRGMHYQSAPHEEVKWVRCIRGATYDVILDLRPNSPTYFKWQAVELSAANGRVCYIPQGCAHGFQTLEDDTEVLYQISEFYDPEAARGVRWNDPAFDIRWPDGDRIISVRDQQWPDYR